MAPVRSRPFAAAPLPPRLPWEGHRYKVRRTHTSTYEKGPVSSPERRGLVHTLDRFGYRIATAPEYESSPDRWSPLWLERWSFSRRGKEWLRTFTVRHAGTTTLGEISFSWSRLGSIPVRQWAPTCWRCRLGGSVSAGSAAWGCAPSRWLRWRVPDSLSSPKSCSDPTSVPRPGCSNG